MYQPPNQPGYTGQQEQPSVQPLQVPPYTQQPSQHYQQPMYPQQQQPYYPPQMQQPNYPQQQPYPGQPSMMQQPPYMQPPQMYTNVNVNVQRSGPGFFIRAIYFLFIGWWVGYIWLNIGFGLCGLIITLPLGLMMLNRLPQVMTLKQPGTSTSVNVNTVAVQQQFGGPAVMVQNVNVNVGGTQQLNFLIRAIYFLFVGWWAGYIWANLAYACCVTLILLPVGVMMFDRLPLVLTLRKN